MDTVQDHNVGEENRLLQRLPPDQYAALLPYLEPVELNNRQVLWQPDATICGGMAELRRIAAVAAARGIRVCPHSAGTPIALAANLHAVSGAATLGMLEYSGRIDRLVPAFRGGAAIGPDQVTGGALRPPAGPGIGVEPEPDIAERYPYVTPPPLTAMPALYQGSV